MNRKAATSILVALTMATGPLSFAQGNSDRNHRNKGQQQEQHGNSPKPQRHDNRDFGRHHERERARGERGVGPQQGYYRGDRLPAEYRHKQYVVEDWRGHHLSRPPRGQHWVRSGNDFVLIAITTGIIASILLSR